MVPLVVSLLSLALPGEAQIQVQGWGLQLGPSWVYFCSGNSVMHVTAGAKNTHCGHHSFLLSCFLPLSPACCALSGDKEGQASGGVGLFGFLFQQGQGCETLLLLCQVLKWWQFRITMETQPLLGSQC